MRKLAIALVAATTVGAAVPAAAQVGFYAVPSGISVNVGPGFYIYGQYPSDHHFYHWRHGTYRRNW